LFRKFLNLIEAEIAPTISQPSFKGGMLSEKSKVELECAEIKEMV
jgi:hypothetical protein